MKLREGFPDDPIKQNQLLLLSVYHLNGCLDLVADDDRIQVAALNLQAAELAIQKSAMFPACEYLEVGGEQLALQPRGPWETAYSLTLNLMTQLARAQYFCHKKAACRATCQKIVANARRFCEALPAHG